MIKHYHTLADRHDDAKIVLNQQQCGAASPRGREAKFDALVGFGITKAAVGSSKSKEARPLPMSARAMSIFFNVP